MPGKSRFKTNPKRRSSATFSDKTKQPNQTMPPRVTAGSRWHLLLLTKPVENFPLLPMYTDHQAHFRTTDAQHEVAQCRFLLYKALRYLRRSGEKDDYAEALYFVVENAAETGITLEELKEAFPDKRALNKACKMRPPQPGLIV